MSEPDRVLGRLGQDGLDKLPVTAVISPLIRLSLQLKIAPSTAQLLGMQQWMDERSHPPSYLVFCYAITRPSNRRNAYQVKSDL
jgi:hypothetical protein